MESIADELADLVRKAASRLIPGNPFDPKTQLGAVIDESHLSLIASYVDIGREQGARLIAGGSTALTESGGSYFTPTVFDRVTSSMRIAEEEIFGPILCILKFASVGEAISLANDTPYGLSAAVWCRDIDIVHNVAKSLRCGEVKVNCQWGGDLTTPFGGVGLSGFGRNRSLHALDKYSLL